jgi:hypothetical protein
MDGFTDEQIQHLAQYILDEYGPDLTGHELTDCALLVLEGIADHEMAGDPPEKQTKIQRPLMRL